MDLAKYERKIMPEEADRPSSHRGGILSISPKGWDYKQPLLTVELCTKWYELFLLTEGETGVELYSIHFGFLEDAIKHLPVSAYCDHVPNPLAVRLFARQNGYEIDELAWDLIKGRWQNEYVEQTTMECDRCDGAGFILVNGPGHNLRTVCRACEGLGETKPTGRKHW